MSSSYMYEALVFLHFILLVNKGNVTKNISCSRTHITGTLIGYTVQKITRSWIVLTQPAGVWTFSEIISFYLVPNRTQSVIDVLSMKKYCVSWRTRPMISQNPLILWVRRKRWHLTCGDISSRSRGIAMCDVSVCGAHEQHLDEQYVVYRAHKLENVSDVQLLRPNASNGVWAFDWLRYRCALNQKPGVSIQR